jgi:hypothetical protein
VTNSSFWISPRSKAFLNRLENGFSAGIDVQLGVDVPEMKTNGGNADK